MDIKYNISQRLGRNIDQELVDRYEGNNREELSYRGIAEWFNKQMMRAEFVDADLTHIDRRVEVDYDVLDGNDDDDEKQRVINTLEKQGVDAKNLANDFVGDTTVYNYLTEELGVHKEKEAEDPSRWGSADVEKYLEDVEENLELALPVLKPEDNLDFEGGIDVDVVVYVSDENGTARLTRVLDEGHVTPQQERSTVTQLSERANNIIPDSMPLG